MLKPLCMTQHDSPASKLRESGCSNADKIPSLKEGQSQYLMRCRMRKLMYRVVFPFDLKLRNTTDDCPDADQMYSLFAVVVHVGSGPNHGDFFSLASFLMPQRPGGTSSLNKDMPSVGCLCETKKDMPAIDLRDQQILQDSASHSSLLTPVVSLDSNGLSCALLDNVKILHPAGHYVSFIKSHEKWLLFDDEQVEAIHESTVQLAFGSPSEYNSSSMDHGYILMYNRDEPASSQSSPLAVQPNLPAKRAPGVQ